MTAQTAAVVRLETALAPVASDLSGDADTVATVRGQS
jgi:hypothetical protein